MPCDHIPDSVIGIPFEPEDEYVLCTECDNWRPCPECDAWGYCTEDDGFTSKSEGCWQ